MSARVTLVRLGVSALALAALLGGASAASADDVPGQGVDLQAQVTAAPSSPDSQGSGSSLGDENADNGGGSGWGGASGNGSAPSDTQVGGDSASANAAVGTRSTAPGTSGVLAVSGLRVTYRPTSDPRAGRLHVEATVRNASAHMIDVRSQFWSTTAFGLQLDRPAAFTVERLMPGEMRVVETDLSGVGQWSAVVAHLTLTPPAQVDGGPAAAVTRDRYLMAPPWFSICVLAVLGSGVALWRWAGRPLSRATAAVAAA